MTDDSMTGPWVLALGTLAVGVVAVSAEVLRRRRETDGTRDEETEIPGPPDADDEWAVDRGPERR